MSPAHRKFLISELIRGIGSIGPKFEAFATRLVDYIVDQKLIHRGLNADGHPVGYVVDSVSKTGDLVAEYSIEKEYFETPFVKIFGDIRHARKSHPQASRIILMCGCECGPKAHTRLINLSARLKRCLNIELEIFDARRQAEYIVDQLLLNDSAIEALSGILPNLEKVRAEYAATNLVPQPSAGYIKRSMLEAELRQALKKDRIAIIAGISGSGKSETSVAITRELADSFELAIWISATDIRAVEDLNAVDVERRGHKLNLMHLLRDRSCFAILDDLQIGVTSEELKSCCGVNSAILVTRQSAFNGDIRIPLLSRDDARLILERNTIGNCPDNIFDIVWNAIGGHPLALRLLNVSVRAGSWDTLAEDCSAIGEFPDKDRLQRLADRLLGRLKELLGKELAFFTWCESARVDRSFARKVLSPVGLRKLEDACLLAADRNDIVRLHDIINTALLALHIPAQTYSTEFDMVLDSHVEKIAFDPQGDSLNFINFCQVHGVKLEKLLRNNPNRSTCLYCVTHSSRDQNIDFSLLGDPVARSREIELTGKATDIQIAAVCEAVETIYRNSKIKFGIDAARKELEFNISAFEILADIHGISAYGRRTSLHHKAKALRNLQRYQEAIPICNKILAEFDSPATKLLLARLLLFERDMPAKEKSRDLLFELLQVAQSSPNTTEISITLAAIETLGRWQLKNWFREALQRFGELVANYIVESAVRGFDQAFVAFAAIGRELRYNDQDLFANVFTKLPRWSPSDARDDQEKSAWGHILLAASEANLLKQPEQYAKEAIQFYKSIENPDSFSLQQHGHALVLLGQFDEAGYILRPLVEKDANPWNCYWLAKSLFGINKYQEAIILIDRAILDPKAAKFLATLFEHRWEIRRARGDLDALLDLEKAFDNCQDQKHKGAIAKRLADARLSALNKQNPDMR